MSDGKSFESKSSPLDERLERLFRGLDVTPGFDAHLMARIGREATATSTSTLECRRRLENRYRLELQGIQRRWRRTLSCLTLDSLAGLVVLIALGIALEPAIAPVRTALRHFDTPQTLYQLALVTATVVGVLTALTPVIAERLGRRTRAQ